MTLVQKEIKKIYVGTNLVRPPYKREPGANTLAYYPLETDTKDYSGNGRNGTNSNVTFSNGVGVFNGSSSYVSLGTGDRTKIQPRMTISAWFKWNGATASTNSVVMKGRGDSSYNGWFYGISIYAGGTTINGGFYNNSDYNYHPMNFRTSSGGSPTLGPTPQANKWYNVVITNYGTLKKAYVDGVLFATETATSTSSTTSVDTRIGARADNSSYFNGNISNVIFENKTRTAQEIADYYNQTKSDYGL